MNADQFRKIIMKKYRECMEDCQIPTGALAQLNPAEFFAYSMWEDNKEQRKDLVSLSVAIDQMEKRMQKGLFNNAVAIARENMDIANKYNPLCQPSDDEWLMIKKQDYNDLKLHMDQLPKERACIQMNVEKRSMQRIINNCFHKLGDIK